ncbi:MAG: TatD family hydrolase [Candidatus Cloacimonadales bacterium]
MFDYGLVDAHCHLADSRLQAELKSLDQVAGNTGYISCALNSAELKWHLENSDPRIKFVAGIHPLPQTEAAFAIEQVAELCAAQKISGIGEIGLDARAENYQSQKNILLQQLELARDFELPVVLHVVKSYYQLAKLLQNNFPQVQGYLHGFHSSEAVFELFAKYDLAFSLGCRPPAQQVCRRILQRGHFLLETDAPFQKPFEDKQAYNRLSNLTWVVKHLQQNTKFSAAEIKSLQYKSLGKIFG